MAKRPVNEAPIGWWVWLGLVVLVIAYVWFWDSWLHRHNYEYMTTEFAEALGTTWSIMLLSIWCSAFIGVTGHFILSYLRDRGRT